MPFKLMQFNRKAVKFRRECAGWGARCALICAASSRRSKILSFISKGYRMLISLSPLFGTSCAKAGKRPIPRLFASSRPLQASKRLV
jgi:hypothetical protein